MHNGLQNVELELSRFADYLLRRRLVREDRAKHCVQWVRTLPFVPDTQEHHRYHMHESHVQKERRSPLDFTTEQVGQSAVGRAVFRAQCSGFRKI